MLGLVGFSSTGLYWPGISGAATTPRWAALFLTVPWLLRGGSGLGPAHYCGVVFVLVCAASLAWTPDLLGGINQLFLVMLCAALFWLGTETADMRPFYIGAGLGIALSSAVAIVQSIGWSPVPILPGHIRPAGLFVNENYLAEAAVLVVIAAAAERMWWLVPLVAPAVWLPHARGAMLALAVTAMVWVWPRWDQWLAVKIGLTCMGVFWLICNIPHGDPGVNERLVIWQSAARGVTWLGHGLGSFWLVYQDLDLRAYPNSFPEFPHNEFLHIVIELGIAGLVAAVAFCLCLAGPLDTSRLVLVALFVESCFAFPLHLPATAAIGFVVAGHAMRDGHLLRRFARWRGDHVGAGLGSPSAVDLALGNGGTAVSVRATVSA